MKIFKRASLAIVLISIFFVANTTAYAQESTLKASVRNTEPRKPVLVLRNTSDTPCQVVQSSLGAVSITRVLQDGKEISPLPIEVALDDGLDVMLARELHTLQPNETIEIPLQVIPYQSGYALQTITWSHDAGAFGLLYPLQPNKPYTLEVTYAAPISVTSGAPLCGIASGTSASTVSTWLFFELAVILFIFILVVMVFIWLLRSRKKSGIVVKGVVLLFVFFFSFSGLQKHALADYAVPDSASPSFNDCMGVLNAHRDITGPVLDAIAGRHIVIEPIPLGTNYTTAWPDGTFHIYWDPTNRYNYYSDDGSDIVSTPCDRLFHEMYHIYDILNNTVSRDLCDGSNIETKEVMAVRAQNRLRVALGLRPRTHYDRDPLPAGECTPPAPVPACTGACGETNGDPHLLTFDKLRYDFQAMGEFVAARDNTGGFEVQTRQQPWPGSRYVSVNTAIAMRVGTDRVELQMHEQQLSLVVNGIQRSLADISLPSGGMIKPTSSNQVTILWPDGSTVRANTIGTYGLYLIINPAQSRAGKLEGLLGNFNGNSKDDLKLQNSNTIIDPTFENLYPAFADSWRVDDTSSLFTYDPGKNTKTYTDYTFPDKYIIVKDLPSRTAAEALCRSLGVTDPAILENCILDVALTGRPEFARAASNEQLTTRIVDSGGKTWKVIIGKPGESASVMFNGKTGEKIFLDVSQSTLPDQCGVLTLIAPSKNTVSSGCIVGGQGMIDGTILPESGKYTIAVTPSENKTGTAFLRLLTITDQKGTIVPDKGEVIANIDKPGVIAEFRFTGQAGQNVFVDIPESSLPDQCGGFGIKDSENQVIASGCIIHGKGYVDTIQLPATGTYTVFVDPAEQNTGQSTLRLILSQEYKANLEVHSSEVTAQLDKPGSFAELTFSGIAGERVYVEIPSSTLPDQCGGISLSSPDGSGLDSGCIINHKGGLNDKGVLLPQTGIYTITIDPAERNTGKVTIRVHL